MRPWTVEFTYTPAGRPATATDSTGSWVYAYDRAGRVTRVRSLSWSLGFVWSLTGKPREVRFGDGAGYKYQYLADGHLLRGEVLVAGAWVMLMGDTWDPDGKLDLERWEGRPCSPWRNWDHSTRTGRVSRYWESLTGGTENHDVTVGWTDAGRLASVIDDTNSSSPTSTTTYSYDPAGQLVTAQRVGGDPNRCGTYTYRWGRRGERLSEDRCGVASTYTWDTHTQLAAVTVADDPATPQPDARQVTFSYDPQGRRVARRVVADPGGAPVQERADTYTWDACGRLARLATVWEAGNTRTETRTTSPDGDLDHIGIALNGQTVADLDLEWDPTQPVRQIAAGRNTLTGEPWTRAAYGVRRISLTDTPGYLDADYYSDDHLESATAGSGATAVAPPHGYEPFGEPIDWAVEVFFGYRGELHLDTLIHLRNRGDDPQTGIFLTRDPLDGVDGTPTVANPYHYADNDPLNKTDPLGLRARDCNMSNADGKCPVVINDVDPGFKAASNSYDVPERGQFDFYQASWYQAPIAAISNQLGFDARMVWGIFAQQTTAGRSPWDDHLAATGILTNHPNLGPSNMQLGQVVEVTRRFPGVAGAGGGVDAYRLWLGLIGNDFDAMNTQVLVTTLWLKILNGKLDDAIHTRSVKQIGEGEIQSTKDGGNVRLYRRSALLGAGHFADYVKWWGSGRNLYQEVFTFGDSLKDTSFVRSISQDDGSNTYTWAMKSYCNAGAFVCS